MKKAIIRLARGCLLLLAIALCAGVTGEQVSARSQTTRPNVVWFVVDDMSANFSCYGEKLIQTPIFMQVQLHGGKYRHNKNWRQRALKELGSVTEPEGVTLPPYYPLDPVLLDDWAQYLDTVRYTDYEYAGAPKSADPEKDRQHTTQAGYQPAGFVWNAWQKGYRLGVITSSDHGSTHISYALVYTDDYSREGIVEAIRKRRTYGATDNIILEYRADDHFMGEEFNANHLPEQAKNRRHPMRELQMALRITS